MKRSRSGPTYSSKIKATENAKVAMSNLLMCDDIIDKKGKMKTDGDWETAEDNSDRVGEDGGILFSVEGCEGKVWFVSIKRVNLDQPILNFSG